ncbi:MAG: mechanosensitive ion channel family protein [Spirochaetes bacterium]|nr:mechanosensitive ion channel family protein [Spirochaetota bacterium]
MRYLLLKLYKSIPVIISALIIIIASFSNIIAGQEDNQNKGTDIRLKTQGNDKVIIMLPFFNYSDSEFKYLSTYVPELISKYISKYEGIKIYNPMSLRQELELKNLTPQIFYYSNFSVELLKKLKADRAVTGRYIIQGNTILIDFKVINVDSGQRVDGYAFEGSMDEHLLSTLERYAKTRADWIVEYILSELVLKLDTKQKTRSEIVLDKLRSTKFGKIISNKWVFALLIVFCFWGFGKLISIGFKKTAPRIKLLSDQRIGEEGIRKFRKSLKWVTFFFGVKLAALSIGFSPVIYDMINDIVVTIILAIAAFALIIIIEGSISIWGKDVTDRINPRVNKDLMPLFVTFSKIFIISLIVIVVLSRFDIDVGPFLASIGILGIAIGFAVKDSLANIIGGIFLAIDRSIAAGDMVTIDNDTGIIKEVGLRNTKLLTYDNEIIVIPNGELANKRFKNFVLPDPSLRVVVIFSVVYGSDVDRVEAVVLNALKTIDEVLSDPEPQCFFEEMADFSLVFHARFWISDYNARLYKKKEATKVIYKSLNEAGIGIPFPTHTVYLKRE